MSDGPTRPISLRELAEIDVGRLKRVGDKRRTALASVGVETVLDLLTTYPRRWIDRTNEASINTLVLGEEALVIAEVRSVNSRTTRNRRTMVSVVVGDTTGKISLVFFNQPWRAKQLAVGMEVALFGRVDEYAGGRQMTNPIVDLIGDRTGRIVPVYPQSEKARLTTWEIAGWVEEALRRCEERGIADPVPEEVRDRLDLVDRAEAIRSIHQPESMRAKDAARRRLAFDELLRVQAVLVARKRELERSARGVVHDLTGALVERFHAALPFPLTAAQRRTLGEIDADLASAHPMHRLLQGDVGAGKTVVAVSALLVAVEGGHQGALMAPTEVLAEQHHQGIRQLLDGVTVPDGDNLFGDRPLRIELLTNRVTGADRREVLAGLADGSVDLVIGTHALIQEAVDFSSLGLVVVDEQHRFGVEQRAALRDKGIDRVPDVLVMTATPIPRTAAMTVYGDLDVSVLDELPPGRTPISTRWANGPLDEEAVWQDVRERVAAGQQAYVVCPLVEESEKL
ncbi:MAG: ATP-dependent DNA helicase RecG, partial [Actinobacteria bacterium]|nr:ATP-dependent DNA helicase RecG [Actinomycetota bacterium]